MLSRIRSYRLVSHQRLFNQFISTKTKGFMSYLTEDNIMVGNDTLEYPKGDLFSVFSKKFEEYGDKQAIVDGITGNRLTFTQLLKDSKKFASFLDKKGYKEGDRLCIHVPNCVQYVSSMFGTLANGMVFNTANPAYTSFELNTLLKSSEPKALITNSNFLDVARKCIENTDTDLLISIDDITVNDSGVVNMSDILQNGDDNFSKELTVDPENDTALLLFSSGTTGLPKGVMIKHEPLSRNVIQMMHGLLPYIPDTCLCVLPMFHLGGIHVVNLLSLYCGNAVVTLPSFDPTTFLKCIETYKIGRLTIVPPIALFMLNHPMVDNYDLSSVTQALIGAAPVDEVVTNMFKEKFPQIFLVQTYGMTETLVSHLQPNDSSLHKPGSCGQILSDMECKIACLETGKALGPFEQGEVFTRGPHIMKGYINNPEATAVTITEDGWLRSGDLGYYDNELNLFVIDRLKELIKYKGFQVAPAELEDLLISHKDIQESCVIGIPCERAGELPRAYVVSENVDLTEEEVQKFVSEYLSEHKWLRGGVEFVTELPKSASGKLLRRVLKDQYINSL